MPSDPLALAPDDEPGGSRPAGRRRRIALACMQCRLRKSKCDGVQPSCGYCSGAGLRCAYKDRQRPARSRGSGNDDRRLKAIEQTLHQLVRARDDDHSHGTSSPITTVIGERSHRDPPVPEDVSPPNLQRPEPTIDGLATVQGWGCEEQYFGPSANITFLKAVSRTTSSVLRVLAGGDRLTRHHAQETLTRLPSPTPRASESLGIATPPTTASGTSYVLPCETEVTRLLKLYFSNTGILFPFISEKQVFASYHDPSRSRGSSRASSLLCLLNAIFAFATIMESKDGRLDSTNTTQADVFYHRALSLAELDRQTCGDIETVQYLILLSQYCQISQRSKETWKFHGLAVQSATQIGLFSNSVVARYTGVDREVRKRLWYGCFILDRSLSVTLGRPPLIQNEFVSLEMPLDVNLDDIDMNADSGAMESDDCVEKAHSATFFIATIQLYKIIGSIIANLYGHNINEGLLDVSSEILKHIADVEDDLFKWKQNLHASMLLRPWEDLESGAWPTPGYDLVSARLSAIVQLRYLNARILLHRPILQWLSDKKGARSSDLADQARPYFVTVLRSSVETCQSSATCIIDLVWTLSSYPNLLGARWFAVYFTFNAALVLFTCFLLDPIRHPLGSKLYRAVEATQKLGSDTNASLRVVKILRKLIDISHSLKDYPGLDSQQQARGGSWQQNTRVNLPNNQSAISRLGGNPYRVGSTTNESHHLGTDLSDLNNDTLDLMDGSCPSWDPVNLGLLWSMDGIGTEMSAMLDF